LQQSNIRIFFPPNAVIIPGVRQGDDGVPVRKGETPGYVLIKKTGGLQGDHQPLPFIQMAGCVLEPEQSPKQPAEAPEICKDEDEDNDQDQ
jgi:hypothetical protein